MKFVIISFVLGLCAWSNALQSYGVPSYSASAPSYSAPSYSPPKASYAPAPHYAPSYSVPSYSAPSYSAPSYSAPSYSAPSYSAPSYSAPSYSIPSYKPSKASYAPVPSYSSKPSYGGYRADMLEEVGAAYGYSAVPSYSAPVYPGPSKLHSYPSPAPKVPCGTNLLFSCQPSAASVPCQSPAYSAPSYSAPSYSVPTYSAISYSVPSYSAPAQVYRATADDTIPAHSDNNPSKDHDHHDKSIAKHGAIGW